MRKVRTIRKVFGLKYQLTYKKVTPYFIPQSVTLICCLKQGPFECFAEESACSEKKIAGAHNTT